MAATPLVSENIKRGQDVLNLLKDAKVDISAALWWYSPESERWVLLIATKDVEKLGPAASYQRLREILSKSGAIYLSHPSISLIEPRHPLVSMLRDYFSVRQDPHVRDPQISQHVINGYALDGAYVYYL